MEDLIGVVETRRAVVVNLGIFKVKKTSLASPFRVHFGG